MLESKAERLIVNVPISSWMLEEFEAELRRSLERESERLARREISCPAHKSVLQPDQITDLLAEVSQTDDLDEVVAEEYLNAVALEVKRRFNIRMNLKFEAWEDDFVVASVDVTSASTIARYFNRASSIGHSISVAAKEISVSLEQLIERVLESDDVQMRILDQVASSSDALCADRFVDSEAYERNAALLRAGPLP